MCDEKLGYYSDSVGKFDTLTRPEYRNERCLNCNLGHGDHYGWACSEEGEGQEFDDIPWDRRYLTVGMRKSRGYGPKGKYAYLYNEDGSKKHPVPVAPWLEDKVAQPAGPLDMSDWRVWAKVGAGNCACNIPKHQCKYHGSAKV